MKISYLKLNVCLVITTTLMLFACSDDDTLLDSSINLEASDIVTTISENPPENQVIGIINVNESEGTVYSISSSEPSGAFAVDATGQVIVANAVAFDYETRTSLNAVVTITNGESQTFSNVTVNLTDADDIMTLLTTSRAAYETTENSWIEVTEAEYNILANRMANVTKVGVIDEDYNIPGEVLDTAGGITIANSMDVPMPFGSYLFAFKYYSSNGTDANSDGQVRPKVSEEFRTSGYIGRGPLPAHGAGNLFFVKAEMVATSSSNSYLGVYSPYSMGWKQNSNSEMYYRFGNGSALNGGAVANVQVLIQGLTTTLKQWE